MASLLKKREARHKDMIDTYYLKLNEAEKFRSKENSAAIIIQKDWRMFKVKWKFDDKKGTLAKIQTLSTLPPDYEGESAAADIKITPDGRFAYVSNRDVTKREEGEVKKDTLAGVAIHPKTGRMKIVGHFATASFPRSFCIDLTGSFIFAAGQRDATLVSYRIDSKTGTLNQLATYKTGSVPIWVMCGEVED